MSDELKSAWELAQEKLNEREDMAVEKLSEEQKQAIAEIRNKYRSRIAEVEINTQSRIKDAVLSGAHEELEKLNKRMAIEKLSLNQEMEREIEKIRNLEKE